MTITEPVQLTGKEVEALMWALGEIGDRPSRVPTEAGDPLKVLLDAGHPRRQIIKACARMFSICEAGQIVPPVPPLEQDILRVAVENSSWIKPHEQFGATTINADGARRVLREFAAKLDALGIEVNHLPNN